MAVGWPCSGDVNLLASLLLMSTISRQHSELWPLTVDACRNVGAPVSSAFWHPYVRPWVCVLVGLVLIRYPDKYKCKKQNSHLHDEIYLTMMKMGVNGQLILNIFGTVLK